MPFSAHNIRINPQGPTQQKTTCPKCSPGRKKQKEKCLSVNLKKGIWHCHHCGWKGSLSSSSTPPLGDTGGTNTHKQSPNQIQSPPSGDLGGNNTQVPQFHLHLRPFTEADLAYWKPYHITEPLLTRYQVHSVAQYAASTPEGKAYNVEATPANPIFAYQVSRTHIAALVTEGAFKLYRPKALRNRFRHLGTRPKDFVFGYAQLPTSGPLVILTGGEKDVLTFAYLGQPAICLNSETALPSPQLVKELNARFQTVAVCYDADDTGQRMAAKLTQDFSLQLLELPPMQPGHKDISDYIAHHYPLTPLLEQLSSLTTEPTPIQAKFTSQPFTLLINRHDAEPASNMVYLGLPPVAMGYVVGPPKSGKTTFCEGLAFSIASGLDTYMGYPLQPANRKVILFSFEEYWRNRLARNILQVKRLLPSQGEAWLTDHIRSIDETFPRHIHAEEDWALLEKEIRLHQPGTVFIDSLSRLYTGSIEDSRVAQSLTKRLRQLVQDHQILLILIHHTPKQIGRPLTPHHRLHSRKPHPRPGSRLRYRHLQKPFRTALPQAHLLPLRS